MLSHAAMQQLREAYLPLTPVTEAEVLEQLGQPSRDEIIETALAGMQSADRNVRVLMLRVLVGQSGARMLAQIDGDQASGLRGHAARDEARIVGLRRPQVDRCVAYVGMFGNNRFDFP